MLPPNVVVRQIIVTDLSQQLKAQRDFLKWMSRRYLEVNPDQSAAFATGARLFDELRGELLEGLFDAGKEDLLTELDRRLANPLDPINDRIERPVFVKHNKNQGW
jgi:hypothetical protein